MYRIIFFFISLLLILLPSLLNCDAEWIGPTLKKYDNNYIINNKQIENIILPIFIKKGECINYDHSEFFFYYYKNSEQIFKNISIDCTNKYMQPSFHMLREKRDFINYHNFFNNNKNYLLPYWEQNFHYFFLIYSKSIYFTNIDNLLKNHKSNIIIHNSITKTTYGIYNTSINYITSNKNIEIDTFWKSSKINSFFSFQFYHFTSFRFISKEKVRYPKYVQTYLYTKIVMNRKIEETTSLFFEKYSASHNSIFKKKKKNIYSYSYFINFSICRIKRNSKKVYTFSAIFYKFFELIYSIIEKGKKITSNLIWNNFYASYFSKGDIFMNEIKRKVRIMNDLVYDDDDDENNDMLNRRNFKNNTNQYFTCFLDKAKENPNALNEIDKWINPKTKSCYCHEEHAEPCSLDDISEINQLDSYMNNEMCNSRNNNKNDEIFIALAGYNILKCKHAENKNMNEHKNKNNEKNDNNIYQHDPNDKLDNEQMYKYCKYGLKLWNDKNMYNYNNCGTVKSLDEKNKNICIEKCQLIQTLCGEKRIQFYSFDVCRKYYETNSFTRYIFVHIFKYFDDNCTYFDPNNHGIVLCKHTKIKCNFSSWSDWSECTKSCLKDEYDIEPIQKRTRFLSKDMEYASNACSSYVSDDNNMMEVQICVDLPYCDDINDSNKEVTSKIKKGKYPDKEILLPFVISLDEINKANALKELNNNDTDLTSENFIINKSEILTNCVITDMNKYDNYIKYNEKNRSCSCPNNEPACYFKDIYNSSTWKKKFEILCKQNNNINIVTADFVLINCNMLISLNKKEISINTYLAMTFDCRSPLFQYLFCSKTSDHNKKNLIYMIITIVFGAISAIYLVYLIVKEIIKYKDICFQLREKNISQNEKKYVQTETPSENDIITDTIKKD
ncbi:conserved Plasmodium protein, unknown function [Plasmodium berghei]|uniref:Thrombospondin-related protein 1 n=2 Tax=Plasmodium berghei TaxID=5821 RepID=A0A509AJP4_PLABA|nr:thrombospondin-related protein 1 [Plasmodium berghei ANKA]CXI24171.1 conserved Plasmodium protein, unknown function [Plasmodium berghei]SCM20264.1 conserved Plasmodium protein, unknown function [Plasmodium berghei]SCN23886.1 conserved Plasmodium protein, unknown function [Plasmodium berghei]SCO59286.1 conserved Plasmodium protein, unknown function [Plasmodium berghei]SCO60293.1 conserved Plasmodium protein, unknown function [Plasmodium berghei]|eukprot:XP_034420825.1 thrombospondin-related protein 1 [Plasmodium berghei ANKA]